MNCRRPPPVVAAENTDHRDHRELGREFSLFSTSKDSPGSPDFHPDGYHIFLRIQAFLRARYLAYGLKEVNTSTISKQSLWETSGHWKNYQDDMFKVTGKGAEGKTAGKEIGEDELYGLKPMNCPKHCLLYKSEPRSYRHLPIRYAEFSPLHRNEISGALSGLTRVTRFHQDDGHIFCRPDQVGEEIERTLQFVRMTYDMFGLGPYKLVLSTRPQESFMGRIEEWEEAESQLKKALKASQSQWTINEGDGAFYGPKIDIILQDKSGKEHQTATIQLDFQLPKRFELSYLSTDPPVSKDKKTKDVVTQKYASTQPVLIHRAVLGSFERFMALLIERYQGRWPFWLSPRQAVILTTNQNENIVNYAESIVSQLSGYSEEHRAHHPPMNQMFFNVDIDTSAQTLNKKVVDARKKGYSLICVVGERDLVKEKVHVSLTQLRNTDEVLGHLPHVVPTKNTTVSLSVDELRALMEWLTNKYT